MTPARRSPLRTFLLGGALVLGVPMAAGPAGAQAVEKHPAPILHGPATTRLDAGTLLRGSTDATPFGVNLAGLMLVDAHESGAVRTKGGAGIDTTQAGATAQAADFKAALAPFLGQPLSYKTIAQIEAAITGHYRDHGRSLVLVSVPPQEITSGVLQVNINTFRLETPPALAGDATDSAYVQRQIRLKPGQEVDTGRLMDDVTWLNLNPFRKVAVAFEPGKSADGTKLTLQVQSKRPWSGYAGASNAGSEDTGVARVFGGFNISALPWQDQQLSYQVNGSPSLGGLWDTEGTKGYVSHAVSYFVPVTTPGGFRFKTTLGLSHVSSFAVPDALFSTGTTTNGQTFELAFPLARKTGTWSLVPELYLGLEHDTYSRRQYFGGAVFDTEDTDLRHVELGLRSSLNGRLFGRPTHGNFDVSVVAGRQETDNEPAKTYRYAKFSITQDIGLEGNRQLNLRLSGQYSPDDLHAIEQLGLGGQATVRGYPSNAASGDSGASLSVQYTMAPLDVPVGGQTGRFTPHVFADWGFVDAATGSARLGAVGVGGQFDLGEGLQATIDVANALSDAGTVSAGDTSLSLRLIARF